MEKRKKQILLEKITEYNKTVNDMSKFQLNKREESLFCEIMQQFAYEYHSKQLRQYNVGRSQFYMGAREFYDKRLREDSTIGSVQLMEEYAKQIIEINFCDGSSIDFDKLSIEDLKRMHSAINLCIEWVNT